MRYRSIPAQLFIDNRKKLVKELKPNSMVILRANDTMPKSADGMFPFRQNPDIFWATGVGQEETILVLFPDCPNEDFREVLFLRETNEQIAIWEGERLSKEGATQMSGIQHVEWTSKWESMFSTMAFLADNIYLNTNEHERFSSPVEYSDLRFARECRNRFPLHNLIRLAPIMHKVRSIKAKEEISLMQTACDITDKAFRRILNFVKEGVMEYEVEAEITHEFIRNGANGHAYEPIIANGYNSCVLHYIENNRPCKNGDILLLDFGANYANYCADLTRVIPVSGKFTARQREVYDAVLRIHKYAATMLKPGTIIKDYQDKVGIATQEELLKLGLLTQKEIDNQDHKWPAYKKYFMHGTSHYLGLDVHDVGGRWTPMAIGNVFTVEPGIYIREESIGIRIENNYVITESGAVDLMKNIPMEADEIEALMAQYAVA